MDISGILFNISVWVLPALTAITFHEAAHGFVAWKLGDDTAYRLGRVSFNPIRHIDPFGTILLPGLLLLMKSPILFGYAKPVPVNFQRLHYVRRDTILVAIAGPATNILLAIIAVLLLNLVIFMPTWLQEWFAVNAFNALQLNLILAIFNMLPIPPLDGGRVLTALLPVRFNPWMNKLELYGFLILIFLLFILPMLGQSMGINLSLLQYVIFEPMQYLYRQFLNLFLFIQ